jgi:hypothetical protein
MAHAPGGGAGEYVVRSATCVKRLSVGFEDTAALVVGAIFGGVACCTGGLGPIIVCGGVPFIGGHMVMVWMNLIGSGWMDAVLLWVSLTVSLIWLVPWVRFRDGAWISSSLRRVKSRPTLRRGGVARARKSEAVQFLRNKRSNSVLVVFR